MVFEQSFLGPAQSQDATVFDVAFEANDRQLAADVANELTKLILDRNAQQRNDRAGDTLQFFEREVTRLKADLTKVETDILKFKNENSETLPDSLEFRRSQQMSQQQSLLSLEREQSELRSRRNTLVLVYETTGQVAKSGPITFEQQQLLDLHRALSDQLAIFSENSPNIQALRKRIAALQAGLGDRQTSTEQSGDKQIKSELDLQLADIDERLQFIAQSQVSIRESIAKLGQTIAATPANETTLNALERNRENIQSQYNTAVERLAEASTGQQIEALSKGVRFSILEPAVPPQDAIRPSRKRIAGLGVAGGLGMGFGLIALLEILNKTIRRPADLMNKLQIQPLATIPYIAEPVQYRPNFISRHLATASIAALALIFGISTLYFVFPDIIHRIAELKLSFGNYS
ncbi:lipopolysaccharide biosynthesis protein [Mesorhizobium sp. CN2-181]|uniref:GumC family protein n=1 Tax=Mesorhizobium yinganensis TaxID=3157707 RepID=UPI0032B80FA3